MIVSRSSFDWTIVVPGHVVVSTKLKLEPKVTLSGGAATAVEHHRSPRSPVLSSQWSGTCAQCGFLLLLESPGSSVDGALPERRLGDEADAGAVCLHDDEIGVAVLAGSRRAGRHDQFAVRREARRQVVNPRVLLREVREPVPFGRTFATFSEPSRGCVTRMIHFPSGDQSGSPAAFSAHGVSCRRPLPSTSTMKTASAFRFTSTRVNTSFIPSGENCGSSSHALPGVRLVTCRAFVPSASTIQIARFRSRLSSYSSRTRLYERRSSTRQRDQAGVCAPTHESGNARAARRTRTARAASGPFPSR